MRKYEARNAKYETNSKTKFLNAQNCRCLRNLNFNNSNLFRISKLGILIFVFSLLLLPLLGCQETQKVSKAPPGTFQKTCIFTPQKISFNQLTEFSKPWQITAYIDVSDQFNSRIKSPGIWRFELYSKVPRSADPMGGRIRLWPDLDLTQPTENNALWQDYLRCYKFELDIENELSGGNYILEVLCFTADGKRLSDTIELKK